MVFAPSQFKKNWWRSLDVAWLLDCLFKPVCHRCFYFKNDLHLVWWAWIMNSRPSRWTAFCRPSDAFRVVYVTIAIYFSLLSLYGPMLGRKRWYSSRARTWSRIQLRFCLPHRVHARRKGQYSLVWKRNTQWYNRMYNRISREQLPYRNSSGICWSLARSSLGMVKFQKTCQPPFQSSTFPEFTLVFPLTTRSSLIPLSFRQYPFINLSTSFKFARSPYQLRINHAHPHLIQTHSYPCTVCLPRISWHSCGAVSQHTKVFR
jgi:hypothetical protein